MDYTDEEKDKLWYEKTLKDNEKYLDEFSNYMLAKGLSFRTVNKHLSYVVVFLDTFLLDYEEKTMQEGIYYVSEYFREWFIRKLGLPSESTLKASMGSVKKFYKCMLDLGNISKEDYKHLQETYKREKSYYLKMPDQYLREFDFYQDYGDGDYFEDNNDYF